MVSFSNPFGKGYNWRKKLSEEASWTQASVLEFYIWLMPFLFEAPEMQREYWTHWHIHEAVPLSAWTLGDEAICVFLEESCEEMAEKWDTEVVYSIACEDGKVR